MRVPLQTVLVISRGGPGEYVPLPADADRFTSWPEGTTFVRAAYAREDGQVWPLFVEAGMREAEVLALLGAGAERH